ncbi:hypothetical protein [Kitasatospora sp. GP82]|uniref:hypothetical protein n=1 Tax=Kitasatospora sp. GP82 TaxID=3035089 RepID=UPI002473B8C3|nr:hypothetical protein [Kitasatospora sp. GP82]MDH6127392.1 hypothetical protein [Kitasatospora sp. GP82]
MLDDTPDWDLIEQRRQERKAREEADRQVQQAAREAEWEEARRQRILVAREINDQMYPCCTCKVSLGCAHAPTTRGARQGCGAACWRQAGQGWSGRRLRT